jgi:Polysaccharide deacetylase
LTALCYSDDSLISVQPERHGLFVISLDFELFWGMRHEPSVKDYIPRLVGARAAIPQLLELFTEFSIHATWATVGFLFFDRTQALQEFAPRLRPQYRNRLLYPYSDLPPNDVKETADSIYFAPSLIRRIADTENQELGTHTFSHYFCLEEGQDIETFRQDLFAARAAAKAWGLELRSLVFPQNEFRAEYIQPCHEAGITAYRGNPPSWLYRDTAHADQSVVRRLGRLADTYVPLSSGNCHPVETQSLEPPVNVPASRFLRPYSRSLQTLEFLRLRRIRDEMTLAARDNLLYHLWWHPHNFGLDTESNLAFLRQILEHYRALHERYGFESASRGEAANALLRAPHSIDIASDGISVN